MAQDPVGIIFYLVITLWLGRMWVRDLREAKTHPETAGKGLPGATPFALPAVAVAIAGTLALVAAETLGEIRLGISAEQSDIAAVMLVAYLTGAVAEEFVFRGFLVVESRGNAAKWISIFAFSAIFALVHPHLWSFEFPSDETLSLPQKIASAFSANFTLKAAFSTFFIFAGSLWFYFVRFFRLNPHASIFVPIAAHLAKNTAVFLIKLSQGHVVSIF